MYCTWKARCNLQTYVHLENLPVVQRTLFCKPCNFKRWVYTENLWAQSKSKWCYDQQSVGQSVLVSSPIWGPRPDCCYHWIVAGLLMWGAPNNLLYCCVHICWCGYMFIEPLTSSWQFLLVPLFCFSGVMSQCGWFPRPQIQQLFWRSTSWFPSLLSFKSFPVAQLMAATEGACTYFMVFTLITILTIRNSMVLSTRAAGPIQHLSVQKVLWWIPNLFQFSMI